MYVEGEHLQQQRQLHQELRNYSQYSSRTTRSNDGNYNSSTGIRRRSRSTAARAATSPHVSLGTAAGI
jgi:hypothetical protein